MGKIKTDRKRFFSPSNRQALAKWITEGLIEDYIHTHVLRASMNNGIIGDLAAGTMVIRLNPTISYSETVFSPFNLIIINVIILAWGKVECKNIN